MANKKVTNRNNTKSTKPVKKVETKKEVKETKKEVEKKVDKKDRGLLFAIIGLAAIVILAVVCFVIPENKEGQATNEGEKVLVIMTVKNYGDVLLELDRSAAPITVDNFLELANSGFYDGTTFHRVVKNFMIQGGSARDDVNAGSDKTIQGEFEANGIKNDISHVRGTISMARGDDPDSASSQFFIMNVDNTSLDGYYAGFGHVISGMEVIDKITEDVGSEDQMELVPENKRPVIESIREVQMMDEEVVE